MAIAHVQSVSAQALTSVTSISTASITTTTGNLLHVGRANFNVNDAATPITPDPGNGWVNAVLAATVGGTKIGVGRGRNITGATGTFTYTVSGGDSPAIAVTEISGCDQTTPLDAGPTSILNAASLNPHASASLTNAIADAIYVFSGADEDVTPVTYAAAGPETIDTSKGDNNAGQDIWQGHLIVSTIAARTMGTNLTANNSVVTVIYVAVYKAAAGGVTVALTGVAGTGAAGTVASGRTVATTGVSATGSVGSLTPNTAVAVTGLAMTGSVGTLAPSTTVGLTGSVGTGAVGTVTAQIGGNLTLALSGVSTTGAVGLIVASVPSTQKWAVIEVEPSPVEEGVVSGIKVPIPVSGLPIPIGPTYATEALALAAAVARGTDRAPSYGPPLAVVKI